MRIDLGTVARVRPTARKTAKWSADDGVVIEVVDFGQSSKSFVRGGPGPSYCRRYVVRCAERTLLRTAGQIEVIRS